MKKIIVMGDSIAAWNPLFSSENNFINFAVPGYTTLDLAFEVRRIKNLESKKILIMIGVNDVLSNFKENLTFENFTEIFLKLRNFSNKIYVTSILPTDNKNINSSIIEINNFLSSRKDIIFCDIYKYFLKNDLIDSKLTTDGIHLNNDGYKILNNFLNLGGKNG